MPEDKELADAAKLVLRVVVGGLMLFHGVHKIFYGVAGVEKTMLEHGIPAFVAYGAYLGEVVAPVLMIVGWLSRPAGLVFAFNMLVAIATAHGKDIGTLQKTGAWAIELQLLYLFGGLVVALLGPGRWSVSRGRSRLG